jgi:RHS repeat-associated protein
LTEVKGGSVEAIYHWHPHYVDALGVRMRASDTHFFLQDANFNVTAAVNDDGNAVVERYGYTPYGEPTILDADFTADSVNDDGYSDIDNRHLYTGREFDWDSGLQLNRHRYYAGHLGRWVNWDPIEYKAGDSNLYGYVGAYPTRFVDPSGEIWDVPLWPRPVRLQPEPEGANAIGKPELLDIRYHVWWEKRFRENRFDTSIPLLRAFGKWESIYLDVNYQIDVLELWEIQIAGPTTYAPHDVEEAPLVHFSRRTWKFPDKELIRKAQEKPAGTVACQIRVKCKVDCGCGNIVEWIPEGSVPGVLDVGEGVMGLTGVCIPIAPWENERNRLCTPDEARKQCE